MQCELDGDEELKLSCVLDTKIYAKVSRLELPNRLAQSFGAVTERFIIYNLYFKNKEALAASVPAYVDAYYEELENQYAVDYQMTAMEKLLDFVGKALEISSSNSQVWQSFVFSLKSPELGVLKLKPERAYFQVLGRLIKGCQAEGSVPAGKSTEELVHQLVILHRGILLQWRICEESFDIKAQGVQMVGALLRGLNVSF